MPRTPFPIVPALALAILAGTAPGPFTSTASGSTAVQPAAELENELAILKDFIHFVKIARYDIAADLAGQLLDAGLDGESFVDLVEQSRELSRFEDAIASALRVPVLEPNAAALDRLFREGKLARVRNPDEIARNIELLTGGLRARKLGRERLVAAGEYAMPQLLDAFLQQRDSNLRARVQQVMVELGRQSVIPLATALPGLDPTRQEAIVDVLGVIPYRTSLPFLVDLHQSTSSESVRQACARAIARLDGSTDADVPGLYSTLADAYYTEASELTSFSGEEYQLLWNFDRGLGLVMTNIRSEVFHEAMSMRLAEESLRRNNSDLETLALWVRANYSRELDSPEGYINPAYAPTRRGAAFFGVAAGPDIDQLVLRRAIDDRDTPLARLAIDALAQTAGPQSLWGVPVDDRYPLLEALVYPNRRVQYESAIALGKASPQQTFRGAQRVVPLLASAVRDASALSAVVLTGRDRESYDQYRSLLEGMGFDVLPPAEGGLGDIEAAIAELPAVDLILTDLSFDATLLEIETARNDDRLNATPVLALMDVDDIEPMRRQYLRDQTVAVRGSAISPDQTRTNAEELLRVASGGPISEMEAADYASRSISVLRDLAVSENRVLDVSEGATILIEVLATAEGLNMIDVAEVLSHVDSDRAQSAIFDRALETEGFEQIEMLAIVTDSGKRFGNLLDSRRVRRLVELAQSDNEALATQVVAAMGALEVENAALLPLMLDESDDRSALMGGR